MDTATSVNEPGRPETDGHRVERRLPREGGPRRSPGLAQRFVPARSRADTVGWLIAWVVLVVAAVQVASIVLDNMGYNWWQAYDTYAYELAAQHLLHGEALYVPALVYTMGAYKYPPIFAQMILPIAYLPDPPVDWAWRIFSVLCLRYMCGSWKLTVLAALQWSVMQELGFGNVTMQLGAVALWSFRDRRAIYLLPWFAGMKFGPALLLPYFWVTRPDTRRTIVIGCAVFAVACLASFVVAPNLWWDYLGTFGWEVSSQMQAGTVVAIVPNHGGTDFAIRFGIALVALIVAIRWRLDWLAFIAATCTMPIFAFTRLTVLVALWPLWLRGVVDRWRQADGTWQRWLSAPLVHLDMLPPLPEPRTTAAASA